MSHRIIVTGASGFVGRHLLDALKGDHRIFGLARRSQARCGAPVHPNIRWFQADIGDYVALEGVFRAIREAGGADVLVHLAAHYDFTGDARLEYWRTNVHGMRNVLELASGLRLGRVVFPSSLAACRLPPPGGALDEASPPDGTHIYARTKRAGEELLQEFADRCPYNTIRFAAMFSDWCEYAPLFMFMSTWLSRAWNRRILAGRGLSAIPYLHVRDGVGFACTLLERLPGIASGEILVASPDEPVSHRELFESVTLEHSGERGRAFLLPRPLASLGLHARDLLGRALGRRPFERPWMVPYIDRRMTVDASRTRARLGWSPRPRLEILRRMPFLIQNLKGDPVEWNRRNQAALDKIRLASHLLVHALLRRHRNRIAHEFAEALHGLEGRRRFPAWQEGLTGEEQQRDRHELLLRHLLEAVRTGERVVLVSYCRDLAEMRFEQGYSPADVCGALYELDRICLKAILGDPEGREHRRAVQDHVTMTLRLGCDAVEEVFEELEAAGEGPPQPEGS